MRTKRREFSTRCIDYRTCKLGSLETNRYFCLEVSFLGLCLSGEVKKLSIGNWRGGNLIWKKTKGDESVGLDDFR